jgi:hypothetical protein
VLGRSSRPKDRTPPTKLEMTFGHAFDRREVSSSKSAVRACVLCSISDRRARCIRGVGRCRKTSRALCDHPSSTHRDASKAPAPGAIRTLPDSSCGTSVWSRATQLFRPAHCWIVRIRPRQPGEPYLSGRTTRGFAVRSADLLFRRGRVRPAALCLRRRGAGPLRCALIGAAPNIVPCFTARAEDLSQEALLEHSRRTLEAE